MTDEEAFEEFMRYVTPELPTREQPVPDACLEADRTFLNNYQSKGEQL